jgi:hypothetical protein
LNWPYHHLTGAIGNGCCAPLFVTIRIVYASLVKVDIETPDGRCGTAAGWVLDLVLKEAAAALGELDKLPY